MSYFELPPSYHLRNIVDTYWIFQGNSTERIFPDASMDIVIPLDGSHPKIIGIMTIFSEITFKKETRLLGIRFKPGMFQLYTQHPLSELRDENINLSLLFPDMATKIQEAIDERKSIQGIIQVIENILEETVQVPTNNSRIILSCVSDILNAHGQDPINNMKRKYFLSERTLERNFRERVGLTMKEFSRIIRFQRALQFIHKNPQENISRLAQRFGYYDQSHLNNEFQRLTGCTPKMLI